jgi:hypothetical protein
MDRLNRTRPFNPNQLHHRSAAGIVLGMPISMHMQIFFAEWCCEGVDLHQIDRIACGCLGRDGRRREMSDTLAPELQLTRMEYRHLPGGAYYSIDRYPLCDGLRAAIGEHG